MNLEVEKHIPAAFRGRRAAREKERGLHFLRILFLESARTRLLPVLLGGAALLSACMPQELIGDEGSDPGEHRAHGDGTTIEVSDGPPASGSDVWARMRGQFSIPRPDSSRVQRQADWFRRHPDYFDRVAERARDYLPYIVREAERRGLPVELALLPVVESAFLPFAYSPARASGLWQFIPSTARLYGLRINWWYDGRRDLLAATSAAFTYLEKLHRDFDGDWLLAVAAYNWGEGNIGRTLANNRRRGKPLDFWSLKVPAETRVYVPRWLAVCDIVARPEHYGMSLLRVPDEVNFRTVELDHQIDLSLAAKLAEISVKRLYRLNAGYRRWATEPQGPHQLLIPSSKADAFVRRVAALYSPGNSGDWGHHEVVAGDTLGELARRYHTSVDALARHNRLDGTMIRVGEHLLVPKDPMRPELHASAAEVQQDRRPPLTRSAKPNTRARRHWVKEGENLWLIARRYGVPISDLVAWNRLDPEAWLMPGQILELRRSSDPSAAAFPAYPRYGGPRYVVRNGDTLWRIANKHGVSVAELQAWNGLDADDWLMPGQILKLYGSPGRSASAIVPRVPENGGYVVRDGDNLWRIALRHAVSSEQIALWNRLSIDGVLQPGQTLTIVPPPSGGANNAAPDAL